MVLTPDMRASMRYAVVDAAASAEAGKGFIQLMAEVGVRHRQLRSAWLCPPALHDGLQPCFHCLCKPSMLLGWLTSIASTVHISLCCSSQEHFAAERTGKWQAHWKLA